MTSQGLPLAQEPKYTVADGKIINRASGEAIPDDEPVFVFRARDVYARTTIDYYLEVLRMNGASLEHQEAVRNRLRQFEEFRNTHSERMKVPDTDTTK